MQLYLNSSFLFHENHWGLDLKIFKEILRSMVSKIFLLFHPDVCLQELSQFACTVEIACDYPSFHSNCSNCDSEQYFGVVKSR